MKAVADNTPSSTTVDDADADHHEIQLDYSSDNDIIGENILIASNSIMAAAESSFSRIINELTPSLITTTSLSSQQSVLASTTSPVSRQLSRSGNDNNNDRDDDCDFVVSRDE